jgi:hypothetical protein
MRTCGECSLCCQLLYVPEVDKPAGEWCRHCKPGQGGCGIYEQRPPVCRDWICQWLNGNLPDYWYPLRSKLVLDNPPGTSILRIFVHPDCPDRWQEEPYYGDIHMLVRKFKKTLIMRRHKATLYLYPDLDIGTQLLINDRDRERFNPEPEIEEDEDEALYRVWYEAVCDDIWVDRAFKEIST